MIVPDSDVWTRPDLVQPAFAHELRNALGPLRTAAHLLRASVRDDAQGQWALDLIDRQVHSISASIDELADLARAMRGSLPLGSDLIDLGETLDSAASACTKALTEKRQTLRWTRPVDRMTVLGDSARLVRARRSALHNVTDGRGGQPNLGSTEFRSYRGRNRDLRYRNRAA